jgi:hypothetical protein
MLDEPSALGKALCLPLHRWLALNGRTGETKLPCVECAGTTEVVFLEHGAFPAGYFSRLFTGK